MEGKDEDFDGQGQLLIGWPSAQCPVPCAQQAATPAPVPPTALVRSVQQLCGSRTSKAGALARHSSISQGGGRTGVRIR
jgi:hypothetical protein